MIHPDGSTEQNKIIKKYDSHIQYMYALMNNSNRLKEVANRANIKIRDDYETLNINSYSLDKQLAKVDIVVLHNYALDEATLKNFYITTPNVLTDIQKELIIKIHDAIGAEKIYLARLIDGEFEDLDDEEINEFLGIRTK